MNCDERRDKLLFRALGALDADEEAELARQLHQECPPLAQVEAEVQADLAQLALGLTPAVVPPTAKAAFMARLAGAPTPMRTPAPPVSVSPSSQIGGPGPGAPRSLPGRPAPSRGVPLLAAAVAAALAVAVTWWPMNQRAVAEQHRADIAEQRLAQTDHELGEVRHAAEQRADQLQHQLADATDGLRAFQQTAKQNAADFQAQIAKADADLRTMREMVDVKVASLTKQLAELDGLLAAAKHEIARRDAEIDTLDKQSKQFADWATGAKQQLLTLQAQRDQLTDRLKQADATLAALHSPQLKVVELVGGAPQPGATARLLWDKQENVWHLIASNLAPAAPGKTYELWFITAKEQKIAAGTFAVDANGWGTLNVPVPAGIGPLALAAVTDEPSGGVAAPSGAIQLVGKL